MRSKTFRETIKRLTNELAGNAASVTNATQKLTSIIGELNKTKRFSDFLAGATLTPTSTGKQMVDAINNLSADLFLRDRNEALIAEFEEIVNKLGK